MSSPGLTRGSFLIAKSSSTSFKSICNPQTTVPPASSQCLINMFASQIAITAIQQLSPSSLLRKDSRFQLHDLL